MISLLIVAIIAVIFVIEVSVASGRNKSKQISAHCLHGSDIRGQNDNWLGEQDRGEWITFVTNSDMLKMTRHGNDPTDDPSRVTNDRFHLVGVGVDGNVNEGISAKESSYENGHDVAKSLHIDGLDRIEDSIDVACAACNDPRHSDMSQFMKESKGEIGGECDDMEMVAREETCGGRRGRLAERWCGDWVCSLSRCRRGRRCDWHLHLGQLGFLCEIS